MKFFPPSRRRATKRRCSSSVGGAERPTYALPTPLGAWWRNSNAGVRRMSAPPTSSVARVGKTIPSSVGAYQRTSQNRSRKS